MAGGAGWAIRLISEARKYSSALAYTQVLAKLRLDELPTRRPYFAFEQYAKERHPGHKPEDSRARFRLEHDLWKEFHTLKLLIREVNLAMERKVESIGREAALKFSALHALVLRDAFAQAARQTTALLKKQYPKGAKPEREAVLSRLAAFTEADIHAEPSDGTPQQDFALLFPTPLAEWKNEATALFKDFFAHRAAIELVQAQHFDGQPILFPDVEAGLELLAQSLESAVATTNEYLMRRAELRDSESNAEVCESNPPIALKVIQICAGGQWAGAIAEAWLRDARFEAIESDAEQWERWREEFLEKPGRSVADTSCS